MLPLEELFGMGIGTIPLDFYLYVFVFLTATQLIDGKAVDSAASSTLTVTATQN